MLRERAELAERTREQEAERRAQEERLRIARDLHDVVAHTLTTINVQAATAAELLDRNPGHARTALETIEDASRDAINELRAILGILREPGANAPTTPAPGVDDVAELVRKTREGGLDVEFEIDGERPERLAETVSLAAFRIVQESLTNARRHAAGAPVRVRLSYEPGALAVSVLNAAGHSANENGSTGVGIAGMAERAAAVGGSLSAEPVPDGFRVAAELPYTPRDPRPRRRRPGCRSRRLRSPDRRARPHGRRRRGRDWPRGRRPRTARVPARGADGHPDARARRSRSDAADLRRSRARATRVLVLTTFDVDEYVYDALRAGASGFLLKDTRPRELLQAIEVVAAATR